MDAVLTDAAKDNSSFDGRRILRADALLGRSPSEMCVTRFEALLNAVRGGFGMLEDDEANDVPAEKIAKWALPRLKKWIDEQVAELVAHRETLERALALFDQHVDDPVLFLFVLDAFHRRHAPAFAQTEHGAVGPVLAKLLECTPTIGLLSELVRRFFDRALQRFFFREQAENHK